MEKYFVYFIFTAIIGYIYETIAMTVWSGRWDNRGFLFGPLIPIYGAGCLVGLVVFGNMITEFNMLQVFLAGFLASAILEYPTSVIMEKIFHQRWWDYSIGPLNIDGRVSILSSLGFGIGAVLIVYLLNPTFVPIIWNIDPAVIRFMCVILGTLFVADVILSAYCAYKKKDIRVYDSVNSSMSAFVENINPEGRSLYKFMKRHTNWFK